MSNFLGACNMVVHLWLGFLGLRRDPQGSLQALASSSLMHIDMSCSRCQRTHLCERYEQAPRRDLFPLV